MRACLSVCVYNEKDMASFATSEANWTPAMVPLTPFCHAHLDTRFHLFTLTHSAKPPHGCVLIKRSTPEGC